MINDTTQGNVSAQAVKQPVALRVEVLAKKLFLPENSSLAKRVPALVEDSSEYAENMIEKYGFNAVQTTEKGYRLLFLLNHICPTLHHFHKRPSAASCHGDMDTFNMLNRKHYDENTQIGVAYTDAEFDTFMAIVAPLMEKEGA